MTVNGRDRRSPRLKRPPPPPSTRPATPIELWYLECLKRWSDHHKRSPSITELALYCDRKVTPTYQAMLSLEAKGFVRRNDERRFEILEAKS